MCSPPTFLPVINQSHTGYCKGTSYDSELSVDGRDRGGSLDGGCNAGTFRDQGSDHEETGDRSAQMYCAYFIVLTMDPDFQSSLYYPTVCLDHNGLKSTEPKDFCFMSELADRWGLKSRRSVNKRLNKYVQSNLISYYSTDTGWGEIVLPSRYFEFFDYILDQYGNYKDSHISGEELPYQVFGQSRFRQTLVMIPQATRNILVKM